VRPFDPASRSAKKEEIQKDASVSLIALLCFVLLLFTETGELFANRQNRQRPGEGHRFWVSHDNNSICDNFFEVLSL
jgi:hypothetical protein